MTRVPEPDAATASIVIVGAGPRGTNLLERIGANAPELFADRPLTVHFVDPHPPGAGRLWRLDQSELLWMNSMAQDVTMFLDSSVDCAGPIRTGPSLREWAQEARELDDAGLEGPLSGLPDGLAEQIRQLDGRTFASRRVQSAYLSWVFDWSVDSLPSNVTVRVHVAEARGLDELPDGRQRVHLDRGDSLVADVVALCLGHMDSEPSGEHARLQDFAVRNGAFYLPPEFSADSDLDGIRPGEDIILRGFGLAFIDLMVLLTEGRGGRYRTEDDGRLTYLPSGAEPTLHVGSRRGVPYRSKIGYELQGERPPFPRFFGPQQIDELPHGSDFRSDVWPLIAKELGWGHYHELFSRHPVSAPWPEFAARYTALPWDSEAMAELVASAVPDPADRLDLAALDRPLAGEFFDDPEDLQRRVREHIAADVARRRNPRHSADLGVFLALLSVYGQMPRLLATGKLSPRSQVEDLDGWWFGFFSYLASGPPGPRLEQLLALSRAGVVRFLGADMWAEPDAAGFQAGSASVDDVVHARALVEARLPAPTVRRSRNTLLRSLYDRGAASEEVLVNGDFSHVTGRLQVTPESAQVVDAAGRPHPRRYALGSYTSGRAMAAFARPRTNAPGFRRNDALARQILTELHDGGLAAGVPDHDHEEARSG